MKMTVILIEIGALRTIGTEWVKGQKDLEITGLEETIETTALLRSVRCRIYRLQLWSGV